MAIEQLTPQRMLYQANCHEKRGLGSAFLAVGEIAGVGAAAIADKPGLVGALYGLLGLTLTALIGSYWLGNELYEAAHEVANQTSNPSLSVPERHFITRRKLYQAVS